MSTDADILRQRAAALALVKEEPTREKMLHIVEFTLAAETYAFALEYVKKVVPMQAIVSMPGSAPFIAGITSYMGQIIAVIDLRGFFDLPQISLEPQHKIIILQAEQTPVAILAENVHGATKTPTAQLQKSLPTLTGVRARYLYGITVQQTIILDAVALLTDEQLIVQQ